MYDSKNIRHGITRHINNIYTYPNMIAFNEKIVRYAQDLGISVQDVQLSICEGNKPNDAIIADMRLHAVVTPINCSSCGHFEKNFYKYYRKVDSPKVIDRFDDERA